MDTSAAPSAQDVHWLLPINPAAHAEHQPDDWRTRSDATAVWAAQHGMHMMTSTLKWDESGEPLQQRKPPLRRASVRQTQGRHKQSHMLRSQRPGPNAQRCSHAS